ncbi:MAG TPA: ABC transporter substrate-binding protein [Anaerolineae bacterium]|nr:ABC transporter substrate-binding protein [Anaerolineae bacterium]HQI86701.1 ABC transporter substrate-binding protein [Anaerolineae bacterium]
MQRKTWVMAFLAALLALSACGAPEQSNVALIIAVIAPFNGDFDSLGHATRDGAVLAIEEWNQRGGVLGKQVQATLLDGQCDYVTARKVAQTAISEQDVQFIIGEVCSDAAEGVAQAATRLGAVQISPTAVDPEVTLDFDGKVRPLVFRVPFLDAAQGTAAARFALENLGAKSAAVLYAENSDYGLALANAFETTFKGGDGEIVIRATYKQDAESYYDMLQPVRDAAPDILYIPGYYNVMNRLIAQARGFGLLQPIIGSDGWDSPDLSLSAVDGCYFTTHYFPGEPRPEVAAWIQRYTSRYLVPPDTVATMSYDATNLLLTAIQRTGNTDPYQVAATLETLTFNAVSGQMTFDEVHNPIKSVLLVRALNGQLVYVDRLTP